MLVLELENYAYDLSYIYSKENSKGYLFVKNVPLYERLKMYRDLLFSLEEIH